MNPPKKMYDLTQPIYHNCPNWPGQRLTVIDWEYPYVPFRFNAERVTFNTHVATHIDVPYHFFADGKTVDQFPAETFAGPVVFFDLRQAVKPDAAIRPDDLKPHMERVEKGDIVILNTGYGHQYGFSDEYLLRYPYLGGPAAEMLVEAGVKGVGTDALSMGGSETPEKGRPCHLALLSNEVFILEGLFVPDAVLDGKRRYLTCFPMLLNGCGGAPARAVVMEW